MSRYILEDSSLEWVEKRVVYVVLAGSRCQGLSTLDSDFDVKGVFIPKKDFFFSPFRELEQMSPSRSALRGWVARGDIPVEGFLWSLFRFVTLAVEGNPQILEVLFVDKRNVLVCDPLFEKLLSIRDCFLSESLRDKFLGYAKKSLKKIRRHKKWLVNPPTVKPTRESYGISGLKMPKDKIQACRQLSEEDVATLPKTVQIFLDNEKRYQEDKREWDAYQEWVSSRDKSKMVPGDAFGYDAKDALNAVRYPRMASEVIGGQGFLVERTQDREELLEIKSGLWEYDRVVSLIEQEIKKVEMIEPAAGFLKSPDIKVISATVTEVVEQYLEWGEVNFDTERICL
jgi:uncharacterized protein